MIDGELWLLDNTEHKASSVSQVNRWSAEACASPMSKRQWSDEVSRQDKTLIVGHVLSKSKACRRIPKPAQHGLQATALALRFSAAPEARRWAANNMASGIARGILASNVGLLVSKRCTQIRRP
jgi:hypothetical protein